jgi:molybdate transport system substrate-binding protein
MRRLPLIAMTLGVASILVVGGMAGAAEIKILGSPAVKDAYTELLPAFEKSSEHKVAITWAGTVDINNRIQAGETTDLVIIAANSLDAMIKNGKVVAGSRVDLAKSGVGMAVRAGAPKPDISSVDAFKRTLLAAKSIGYSTGPSGVYLTGLFQRLGVADEIKPKLKQIAPGLPVGELVARGEAEIGFQQVPELIHFPGVDLVGPLPAAIQEITTFSGGIHVGAKEVDGAKALVKFLTSPAAVPALKKAGMEPG